jgi:hypothetical protein
MFSDRIGSANIICSKFASVDWLEFLKMSNDFLFKHKCMLKNT